VGAWNVRRWGATNVPYDPWTKTCSIFKLARQRTWNVVLLTDVAFPESTPKQVSVDGTTWTILVAGGVAVALDSWATQTWVQVSSPDHGRALLVHLPREGFRKGLGLIVAYAPTSSDSVESRMDFCRNLAQLKQKVPAGGLMVIGGDFNAEVGNAQAINYPQVFGTTLGTNTSRRPYTRSCFGTKFPGEVC
jgi:hypothetical protein